ncbi:outer membrane protein assembly factor BamD [Apibacter muscae]|uniref:outer membrane protein assembly factor BamD n=1 Tax=Apibacter muscae TaxID=2509004 RepID=UPI0011AC8563|nr:outer membrane protein assembly factor BamD [Apibacter muscae]TWP22964.1 outer membrane protein assembly factor BamD [Apibacter muscae]
MKKIIFILTASTLLLNVSCEKKLNRALKSSDKGYVLKIAEEYEQKKKYPQAISLYEYANKLVVGTDDAPEIAYRNAQLNYLDGNYRLAAHQFKTFLSTYPQDKRAEEAAYMSAFCYYKDSPDYNLDQSNTKNALKELQSYINRYPNSDKIVECNRMMDELTHKLEKKAFENAVTLYKITEYKGSIVAFNNVLDEFPDTNLREEIQIYLLRAKTELAVNSVHRLKNDRLNDAVLSYTNFVKNFPQSEYVNEAQRLKNRLENAREDFDSKEKNIEESKNKKDSDKERKKII